MTFNFRETTSLGCNGFVVAMRARVAGPGFPKPHEWLIVSRWGKGGDHLSIGWTGLAANAAEAPIDLTPNQTAFAEITSDEHSPATFRLLPALPRGVSVAGTFVPAEGYIHLYGSGAFLRLKSEGAPLTPEQRPSWDLEAIRTAWIGEFIERPRH